MDMTGYNQKTKVINGEVIDEKKGEGLAIPPPPSFSRFLIAGIFIGAIFKYFR